MQPDRVHFYSKTDLASYHEMKKAIKVLDAFDEKADNSIADLIEFYQIKLYVDNEIFPADCDEKQIQDAKVKVKLMWKSIVSFWQTIDDSNIIEIFNQVEYRMLEDSFWEITANLDCHKNISREKFSKLLEVEDLYINPILHQEKLVKHFKQEIHSYLISFESSAELLLTEYVEKHDRERKALYFPQNLSLKDKEQLIIKYINIERPNLNYIRLILNINNSSQLSVSDRTLLKAQKVERKLNNEILENGSAQVFGIQLNFDGEQDEMFEFRREGNIEIYSYSKERILKINDPTFQIMCFRALFMYFTKEVCVDLVSKDYEIDSFERTFISSRNSYPRSSAFKKKEIRSMLVIVGFDKLLKEEKNTSVEKLIEHFVVEYIKEWYNISSISFNLPSDGTRYSEKIKILLSEFDSLLKQYKLYCEDGEINLELLAISSKPYTFSQIPSLVENKYFYLNNKELDTVLFLLFSDQAFLSYVPPYEEKHYKSLYDLLENEEVVFGNYHKYQWERLNLLFENDLLFVDHKGYLRIKDSEQLYVLSQLYREESLNYWHFNDSQKSYIDKLESLGILKSESTLFTKAEQSYFNYYLNKKEFMNGFDLRNKYMHGTNSPSEEVSRDMYYKLLRIIVLVVLKIEDDLNIGKFICGNSIIENKFDQA